MSDLRLLIALNSWGIIDSSLPISMLLILERGLVVFVSTKLHQHKKLVYYFWGRLRITVDCSKGIFYKTEMFHCLMKLMRGAAQTWNESVSRLCVDFSYTPHRNLQEPQTKWYWYLEVLFFWDGSLISDIKVSSYPKALIFYLIFLHLGFKMK